MISRIFLCLVAASVSLAAQSVPRSRALVFLHVTTINPGSSSVEDDRAVVIRDGRITEVASGVGFVSPDSAQVVDGTGKFLIPGMWDMHVHSAFGDWFPRGREVILPLFIANGVTGVRDMGGYFRCCSSGEGRSPPERFPGRAWSCLVRCSMDTCPEKIGLASRVRFR